MEDKNKPKNSSKEEKHQKAMENAKKAMEIINKHKQENQENGEKR